MSLASPALAGDSLQLHHLGTSITTFKCTVQEYYTHLYGYATVNTIHPYNFLSYEIKTSKTIIK